MTTLAASTSTVKLVKDFDELMSTPIEFSGYILNGMKIKNLTQEILLGPAFRLLKGARSNYAELEYDFEECYKALSEKLDWENPEGGDYPFDLSKPLPLIMRGKRQKMRRADNALYRFKEGNFPRLRINDIEDMLLLVVQNRLTNLLGDDVADSAIALRMITRSLASFLARRHNQKYRHGVLTEEKMEELRKEKSSFHDQGHQQAAKGRRMMRSLEKFIGGRLYETDLRLLQRTI
ncbi:hypothetical protein Tco_0241785 [Tanacetum coccineum]